MPPQRQAESARLPDRSRIVEWRLGCSVVGRNQDRAHPLTYPAQRVIVGFDSSRKGKPLVREGRKATELPEFAGPPK